MGNYLSPVVDDKNPLYCPTIPASAYLRSLRQKVRKLETSPNRRSKPSLPDTFARLLEQSSYKNMEYGYNSPGSDCLIGDYLASGQGWFSSYPSDQEGPPAYSPIDSSRGKFIVNDERPKPGQRDGIPVSSARPSSLKRKNTFSDFVAPPKYARSIQSVHDSSFDIEVCREQLHFSGVPSSPRNGASFSLASPQPTIGRLMKMLNIALPGIRLEERLSNLQNLSAQCFMDFLSRNGYINKQILDIFSDSDIQRIEFAPSMFDESGLNICGNDIYSVFGKNGSFQSLSEISFTGIHIRDSDIQHIHHLPALSILLLDETGITNEAYVSFLFTLQEISSCSKSSVFLLISLKQTLTRLSLAANPDINNDSVPAITLLSNLSFLSIIDTSIDMVGLRRLAQMMQKDSRDMDIEIPCACESYVDHIQSAYLYMPLPPLITNPDACSQLSTSALRRNLEAHAACNPSIVPSGTRPEMVHRLHEILKVRQLDVLVISMLGEHEPSMDP